MRSIAYNCTASQGQKCETAIQEWEKSFPSRSLFRPVTAEVPAEPDGKSRHLGRRTADSCSPSPSYSPEALALVQKIEENSALRAMRRASRGGVVRPGPGGVPLVSSSKSHPSYLPERCFFPLPPSWSYQVFRNDVYVCRHFPATPPPENSPSPRAAIFEFSDKSRAHLDHICCNSGYLVKSQFCLTYTSDFPSDGEECKRHLDKWLKAYRRRCPQGLYLWVLEFQHRGAPHFHVFLSQAVDRALQKKMALSWAKITKGGEKPNQTQIWWHCRPENWVDWSMDNGNYVMKQYTIKQAQKDVPPEFRNVGRFWGCSRGMHPKPTILEPKTVAQITRLAPVPWEPAAVRHFFDKILRRWQERQMNRDRQGNRRRDPQTGKVKPWKKASMTRCDSELSGNFKIKNGARVVERLLNYVATNPPDLYSHRAAVADRLPF